MPRTARIAPNEHVYHILTRGNNREDVFRDRKDYKKYVEILQRYKEKKTEKGTGNFFNDNKK